MQDDGGELSDYPNEKYKKFFDKFSEIDTLNVKEWRPVHILSYFCRKYEQQYGIKYKFKFNSPSPSKCFEIFQIKKLSSILTAQPHLLKEYIDWIFLNKVVKAKRRLTSISFMTAEPVVNEYKMTVLFADKNDKVDRTTLLPTKYIEIFKEAGENVQTYGDLAFLSQMSDLSFELIGAFIKLENEGFDKSLLTRIL